MSVPGALRRLLARRPAAPASQRRAAAERVPAEVAPVPEAAAGTGVPRAAMEPEIPRGLTVAAGYAWRVLLLGAFVVALFHALRYFSQVTVPLAMAVLLAAMVFPVVERLKGWGWKPIPAALVSLLLVVSIVAGLITFVGQQVVHEWPALVEQSSTGLRSLNDMAANLPFGIDRSQIDQWIAQGTEWIRSQASTIAKEAAQIAGQFGTFVAGLLTALIAAFFFAHEGERIFRAGLTTLVPRHYRAEVEVASEKGWVSLVAYMRAAVIVAAVDAAGVALAALLLQVPLVAALFALTFFLSFIPIVGAFTAGTVAVLLALVTHGWVSAVIMLVAVIAVMQIESTFLQPLVMGKSVDLHPLAVLLGITAGGIISGVLGALVSIPILAFAAAFVRSLRQDAGASA